MRTSLFAFALVMMAAAGTAWGATRAGADSGHRDALVIRAGAPVAMGDGHGDIALRGACWKVAAGWSSDHGRTRVAVAVARVCG
jgi:hypothetical protein